MLSNPNCREDRCLKERCLDGDAAAWGLLYASHFPALVCYARVLLLAGPIPGLTPEDVASNVFGSLCVKDYHLVRYYEPDAATWQAFLRLLAKRQIVTVRRREHEAPLRDGDFIDRGADGGLVLAEFHEFAAELPPTLRQWFEAKFLGTKESAAPPCSQAAERKRLERLRPKFDEHVGPG